MVWILHHAEVRGGNACLRSFPLTLRFLVTSSHNTDPRAHPFLNFLVNRHFDPLANLKSHTEREWNRCMELAAILCAIDFENQISSISEWDRRLPLKHLVLHSTALDPLPVAIHSGNAKFGVWWPDPEASSTIFCMSRIHRRHPSQGDCQTSFYQPRIEARRQRDSEFQRLTVVQRSDSN